MITELLKLHNQLKIYHWQTESYAQHQAFGSAYGDLTDLIDEFIEVFMGKNARIKGKNGFSIELNNIDNSDANKFIDDNIEFLTGIESKLGEGYNGELLNIRDEMVAVLNKLKYLLTLK